MFPIVGGMAETKERTPEAVRRGATIKALREAYGLSAAKLVEPLDITRRYLSYIEAGDKLAPVALCRQIADRLRIPLAAIMVDGVAEDYIAEAEAAKGSAA